ncbi:MULTISPECIES: ribonucleoside-diphosphate reductase subunit alpha [unclassified Paenibacillus]|uniref:ribonucleoside-diphosphate reductase subunit alpha n=1 Tax=unclassified Paenibacillus TaxID=185978 RepID=UPI000896175B|nr:MULTISPECIES: ribonucleoside-diphosphate reductase subunit alpha [unclassified Paenibacillus]SDW57653.1 ribonucleoside-diphosphate reductase alpha chain [Paenibacillus sp. PDC88]
MTAIKTRIKTVTKPENREMSFDLERLMVYISRVMENHPNLDQEVLLKGALSKLNRVEVASVDITNALYMTAVELIDKEFPDWMFVASRIYGTKLYKQAAINREYKTYPNKPYGSFSDLLKYLTSIGIYDARLLEVYSDSDIAELEATIDHTRDHLFTFIGLLTLDERYLTGDYEKNTFELPQERYMIISMVEMLNEAPEKRMELVKEAYWAQSTLKMTTATPTMSNAGKAKGGQLSSCFIDTVDDSLIGIYDSNTDVARLSKMGGGIGVYMGKVRARNSDIRGYKNKSAGVVPWIRQLNNTAVSVDQLGTRKGSIAVYLQDWHRDILSFLDLRLNNGDDRMRAHDIFLGFIASDLFMEAVDNGDDWHLFCPHEVHTIMGFELDEVYDEEQGKGRFRELYQQCVDHPTLPRLTVPAIDIFIRILTSQLETGVPYMFYKDTVNRANPNKGHGIIYCSNLCTEIEQNQSATKVVREELVTKEGKTRILIEKIPGEMVVCNLSSINLGKAEDHELERIIDIQVRMLDNIIDLNADKLEVLQAVHTNQQYRAIGLGTFGYHHRLALNHLRWESDAAVEYNVNLYEKISFYGIKASMKLSMEKGAYPLFKGSEWANGNYFIDRGLVGRDAEGKLFPIESPQGLDWYQLCLDVMEHGIRNGYLFAVAPNGSTSVIAGSTASIDPVYGLLTYEEKTTYKIANPAPDLNMVTVQYYRKNAFELDQHWSIKHVASRQRFIDQGQSFNLYVKPDIDAMDFLELHLDAWKSGVKTTYYVRNMANEMPEECESCAS